MQNIDSLIDSLRSYPIVNASNRALVKLYAERLEKANIATKIRGEVLSDILLSPIICFSHDDLIIGGIFICPGEIPLHSTPLLWTQTIKGPAFVPIGKTLGDCLDNLVDRWENQRFLSSKICKIIRSKHRRPDQSTPYSDEEFSAEFLRAAHEGGCDSLSLSYANELLNECQHYPQRIILPHIAEIIRG